VDPLVKVAFAAARPAQLPQARDAGTNREPRLSPWNADLVLSKRRRPRSDQAHVAHEDIHELRQRGQIRASQPCANGRYTRIECELELRTVYPVLGVEQ